MQISCGFDCYIECKDTEQVDFSQFFRYNKTRIYRAMRERQKQNAQENNGSFYVTFTCNCIGCMQSRFI